MNDSTSEGIPQGNDTPLRMNRVAKRNHASLSLLRATVVLLAAVASPYRAFGVESNAPSRQSGRISVTMPESSKTARGLVTGDDGFAYYYEKSGKLVKGDFVKIDDKTIYYFSQNGRGIQQYFQVHNDRLIQFWNIGRTTCFLVIGDKEALLIDGLYGMGNLKKMMSFFTDKPISLVMSHGSVDHSGAAYAYGEFKAIYLNRLDDDRLSYFGKSPYRRYTTDVNDSRSSGKVDYYDILSVEDYLTYPPNLKYTDMTDGMTFDLGGTTVEAIWAPGHSPGCTAFLIKEMKTLVNGCAGTSTQVNFGTIEDYRKTVLKLSARQNEWNKVYTLHGRQTAEGSAIPLDVFASILETCDGLLRGTLKGIPVTANGLIYGGKGGRLTTAGAPGREQRIGDLMYDPNLILNAQD